MGRLSFWLHNKPKPLAKSSISLTLGCLPSINRSSKYSRSLGSESFISSSTSSSRLPLLESLANGARTIRSTGSSPRLVRTGSWWRGKWGACVLIFHNNSEVVNLLPSAANAVRVQISADVNERSPGRFVVPVTLVAAMDSKHLEDRGPRARPSPKPP